jgi:hypothetical protein
LKARPFPGKDSRDFKQSMKEAHGMENTTTRILLGVAAVTAIGAGVAYVFSDNAEIERGGKAAWKKAGKAGRKVAGTVKNVADNVGDAAETAGHAIRHAAKNVGKAGQAAAETIKEAAEKVSDTVQGR